MPLLSEPHPIDVVALHLHLQLLKAVPEFCLSEIDSPTKINLSMVCWPYEPSLIRLIDGNYYESPYRLFLSFNQSAFIPGPLLGDMTVPQGSRRLSVCYPCGCILWVICVTNAQASLSLLSNSEETYRGPTLINAGHRYGSQVQGASLLSSSCWFL